MSSTVAGGSSGSIDKAEARKARKEAKKETKQKAVTKDEKPQGATGVTNVAKAALKEVVSKPVKEKTEKAASKDTAGADRPMPPPKKQLPSAPCTMPKVKAPILLPDFSNDWTSGAVPLLAALQQLVLKAKEKDERLQSSSTDAKEAIKLIDKGYLRPLLLASFDSEQNFFRVGHLSVIKWLREFFRKYYESYGDRIVASQESNGVQVATSNATCFVDMLLETLSTVFYRERVELAGDAVVNFASEMLQSTILASGDANRLAPCILTLASPSGSDLLSPLIHHVLQRTAHGLANSAVKAAALQGVPSAADSRSSNLFVAIATTSALSPEYIESATSKLEETSSFIPIHVPISNVGSALFGAGYFGWVGPSTPKPTRNSSPVAVVIAAEAILAGRGGAIMAPPGSMLLALAAHEIRCPVVVLAETYKAIGGLEADDALLGGDKETSSHIVNSLEAWMAAANQVDIIPPDLVSVVVTELGPLPATALPGLIRLTPASNTRAIPHHV